MKIPYIVTSSIVFTLQGEPRATHDTDFVISIRKHQIEKLAKKIQMLDDRLDKDAVLDALNSTGMFNLIDLKSGDKVDFWSLTSDPFDGSRFNCRICQSLNGDSFYVSFTKERIFMKRK